jgi:hypothetical protein
MITLVNVLSGERRTASTPIGIENLKASWRFSTDFPVAVDRGISSENLRFYKTDRTWLLSIFDTYGTSAVVDMEFESSNLTFSVALDFSTATYDEIFFEVGYKFSRLADKIKELDAVGKVEVDQYERQEYQLNTSVQSVAEHTENIVFNKTGISFYKTTLAGQKELVTVLDRINDLQLPPIQGATVARTLGTSLNTSGLFPAITLGATDCSILFGDDFCSLVSWGPNDAADSFSLAHLVGNWNFIFNINEFLATYTAKLNICVIAQYRKNNTPDVWRMVSQTTKTKTSTFPLLNFGVNEDLQLPVSLSTTYGGVEYDSVEVHLLIVPQLLCDLATGLNDYKLIAESQLTVFNFSLSHSLTNINRNVFVLPVNNYFERLGLFDNECAAHLAPAMLTSQTFMGRGDVLEVKPTDVMHDVSLLYAVKFVENNGKYVIMPLTAHTPEIEPVTRYTEAHQTALPCYTGAKIAERSSGDQSVKYPEQIFTGTAAITDDRIPANILQLSTSLTTDGGQILQELLAGNGTTAYLLHADNVTAYQLTPTALGRQINEYYMFREVVARLMPFVGSWFRPLQPLTITDCDPYYNPTTGTGSTDTITPPAPMYHHTTYAAKIPVTFALIRAILGGCKRLNINGLNITLKEIEINTEPSVAEVSGFIEL